jgi:hypothetical protein
VIARAGLACVVFAALTGLGPTWAATEYHPADGYVAYPGIAGYLLTFNQDINPPQSSPFLYFNARANVDVYHDGLELDATQTRYQDETEWIDGTAPPYPAPVPIVAATNFSAAYHRLFGRGEVYTAYGDPNTISTARTFIVKYIFYAGAAKGT